MDLYAFSQIKDLEDILKEQNIDVPRLRGLRLMKEEEEVSQEEIDDIIKEQWLEICEDIIEQGCRYIWCGNKHDTRNDILIRKRGKYGSREVVGVRWDKVHGKKRKQIKFEFKKVKKAIVTQYTTFNKYVGKDVIYVHARIGGNNWNYYKGYKLLEHPDYLDRADDSFDCSYCDLYFKLTADYKLVESEEE